MGIIAPTDLIPDYELMMMDKSLNNKKVWEFWKDVLATIYVKRSFQQLFSKFDSIYCLMSTATGYVNSVAELLSNFDVYYIISQESGQTNKLRSWGKVLSETISKRYNSPDKVRKLAEMHNCKIVGLTTHKKIAMSRYEYPKNRLADDTEKVMSIRKTMELGGKKMSQADKIRKWVKINLIDPARKKGLKQVKVNAGEVARQVTGGTNIPNVNNALRGKKLQEMCDIRVTKIEGTPGSTTATYTYEIVSAGRIEERTAPITPHSFLEKGVHEEERGIPELIRELAKLKDDGIITEEEFEKKKKDLLGKLFSGGVIMSSTYTAKYTKISSGYMGQLVEWPEVITEGNTLEECREMLKDALHEMVLAYRQQSKEIPTGGALLEQIPIEI